MADKALSAAYRKSQNIRSARRGESKQDTNVAGSFLIGSADWWVDSAQREKETEDELRRQFVQDRDNPELERRDLMLVNVFNCFKAESLQRGLILPPNEREKMHTAQVCGLNHVRTAFPDDMLEKVKSQEIGLMGFVNNNNLIIINYVISSILK